MLKKSISALALASLTLLGLTYPDAHAHTFSGDESASFLALVESIRAELQVVQESLASNVTLAENHAGHALEHLDNYTIEEIAEENERLARDLPAALADLRASLTSGTPGQASSNIQNINDLLSETVTVRVDREQLTNSTVQALVIANMADGVLENYKAAYGIKAGNQTGHGHGDENGANMTHDAMQGESTAAGSNDSMSMQGDRGNMTAEEGNATVVDIVHYQSAQALANRTLQVFNGTVKALAPANATEAVADLEAGLQHLIQAIDSKEPPADVEVIVHTEVHPNIQKAYNLELQVVPEFPLPLLLALPTIAGIIAASRLNLLRR